MSKQHRLTSLITVFVFLGLLLSGIQTAKSAPADLDAPFDAINSQPEVEPDIAAETIVVPFRSGIGGVQTTRSFAGPVTVTVSHDLGKIEARRRINEGFEKFRSSLTGGMMFNFAEEWTGEDQLSFTARGLGQTIFGTIDIFPQHIRIEATLPNLLAGIAEAITGKMEHEGKLLLEKK